MKEKRVTKKDLLVLIVIFLILLAVFFAFSRAHAKPGAQVQVTVDGMVYGTWPLDAEETIEIKTNSHTGNVLVIKDGYADMTEADCPDRLCVRQKKIHARGETIVCLPHKVVVSVLDETAGDADVDVVVK